MRQFFSRSLEPAAATESLPLAGDWKSQRQHSRRLCLRRAFAAQQPPERLTRLARHPSPDQHGPTPVATRIAPPPTSPPLQPVGEAPTPSGTSPALVPLPTLPFPLPPAVCPTLPTPGLADAPDSIFAYHHPPTRPPPHPIPSLFSMS